MNTTSTTLSPTVTIVTSNGHGAGSSGRRPDRAEIIALAIIVILLTIISILATAFVIKWRSWKKQKQAVISQKVKITF
jgi:hypothetical protein